MPRLLIVGNGMATAYLLQELTAGGVSPFRITVVGDEPVQGAYNRILLSSLLAGDKPADELWMLDARWYRQHRIELISGCRVQSLDTGAHTATLENGRKLPFDTLVLATGSRAHIPAIPGSDLDGVMGFRSMADVARLQALVAGDCDSVVIVGGGLLGLEAAHGLSQLGAKVSLVHRNTHLMNRQLDRRAGQMLQEQLAARGMTFHLQARPIAIEGRGRVEAVRLDNGSSLSCGLLLFAAGIEPNRELAQAAGLACDRGIQVDASLRTSAPSIYALGECCEQAGRTFGLVAPIRRQAEVLAKVLRGDPAAYRHAETPVHLKVSGVEMHAHGVIEEEGLDALVLEDPRAGIYRRLNLNGDRLAGSVLLGDKSGGSWYDELIVGAAPLSGLRHQLLFGQRPVSA